MEERMIDTVLTPIAVSMCLYILLASVVFVEYYVTFSKNKKTSPSPSGHSQFRANELDDSLSRARNISGMTRASKRDSNPLDLSDGHGQSQIPTVKSSGEENRTRFYKFLSISLSLRILFLPIERAFGVNENDINAMIVSASLPTLSWLISFTILTCFYGQVTFMAMARSNHSNTLNTVRTSVVQVVYGFYGSIIFFNRVIPVLTNKWFKILIWGLLSFYNALLFLSILYFGFSLATILKPNLNGGLGLRLIAMSVVCTMTFALRSILDGFIVFHVIKGSQGSLIPFHSHQPGWDGIFGRNVSGYITLELLPTILVLIFMHKTTESNTSTTGANSTSAKQKNAINDETAASLESGEMLPLDQHGQIFLESKTKQGTIFAKRSNNLSNGNVSISKPSRPMMPQQQGPRVISASYGMMRTGASAKGERASLIEKSNSATVSTSYGTGQNEL